ncbi:MAG: hypothetical protein ACLTBR_02975 [Anaerostipes sp.]|uniref:hypothetical protein n=1 Tax=Anaerostipes sp. TaxID=1872530 RepID=UPI003996C735
MSNKVVYRADQLPKLLMIMYTECMADNRIKESWIDISLLPRGCEKTIAVLFASCRLGIPIIVRSSRDKKLYLDKFHSMFSIFHKCIHFPRGFEPCIGTFNDISDAYWRSKNMNKIKCVIVDGLTLRDADFISEKLDKQVMGFMRV